MRIQALSDIHVDYRQNMNFLLQISEYDYVDDILLLAGDVSHITSLATEAFELLANRFHKVMFVPGNHDVWVSRNENLDSLEKFERMLTLANQYGILTQPLHLASLSIIPLFAWYDYSFAPLSTQLKKKWMDFSTCRWPQQLDETEITKKFLSLNEPNLSVSNRTIISFSHFLPRIDVMPSFIPSTRNWLHAVLGTTQLEKQIRTLGSRIHVYGHSHVNNRVVLDNTTYINNAFGYPHETAITRKEIIAIYDL